MTCSGDDVNTVILSAVENCAGVISGCLPTLLPIWHFLREGRSPKSMQQSVQSPSPKQHGGIRPSTFKASFWSKSRPQEVDNGGNDTPGGSFKRLGESTHESYSMKSVNPSAITSSTPDEEANTIRITTDLRQTDAAAACRNEQSGNTLGW